MTALIAQHVDSGLHEILKASRTLWESLPLVGIVKGRNGVAAIEIRNCSCESSLAIRVTL